MNVNTERYVEYKKSTVVKKNKRRKEECKILEIRQTIYSKLNKGQNTFSIMKLFKRKVDKYLINYRAELSYDKGENWKDKIIITKKAIAKREKEFEETSWG